IPQRECFSVPTSLGSSFSQPSHQSHLSCEEFLHHTQLDLLGFVEFRLQRNNLGVYVGKDGGNGLLLGVISSRDFKVLKLGDVIPLVVSQWKVNQLHPIENKLQVHSIMLWAKQLNRRRLDLEREVDVFAGRGEVVEDQRWEVAADAEAFDGVAKNIRLDSSKYRDVSTLAVLRDFNDVLIWSLVRQQVSQRLVSPLPAEARKAFLAGEQFLHGALLDLALFGDELLQQLDQHIRVA